MDAVAAQYARLDGAVSSAVFDALEAAGLPMRSWTISPITADLPFVASPTPLILWIAFYLTVVVGGLLFSPRSDAAAKRPEPLALRVFVQCHNIFLIGLSSYMFGNTVYQAWKNGYNFWGNGYKDSEVEMGRVLYIFYISKWYEFFDTFIMLMKGNLRQVSFLHVYHHVSISFIWWIISYAAPGGDAYYSCFLNSLVHVIMYTYYFLAALVGKDPKIRRKYLWWGQYLTMFQMGQFVSMMVQGAYIWVFSAYPKELAVLLFFYMQTLLALFGNFFVRKYLSSGKSKKKSS